MGFKRIKEGEFTKAKCHICKVGKVEFKQMGTGYCKECKEKAENSFKNQDCGTWKIALRSFVCNRK
jgi:hypothetical protein